MHRLRSSVCTISTMYITSARSVEACCHTCHSAPGTTRSIYSSAQTPILNLSVSAFQTADTVLGQSGSAAADMQSPAALSCMRWPLPQVTAGHSAIAAAHPSQSLSISALRLLSCRSAGSSLASNPCSRHSNTKQKKPHTTASELQAHNDVTAASVVLEKVTHDS